MIDCTITSEMKANAEDCLRALFAGRANIRSELQEAGEFLLFTIDLDKDFLAHEILDNYDKAETLLLSILPRRLTEPRWMVSIYTSNRMLYANVGGIAESL